MGRRSPPSLRAASLPGGKRWSDVEVEVELVRRVGRMRIGLSSFVRLKSSHSWMASSVKTLALEAGTRGSCSSESSASFERARHVRHVLRLGRQGVDALVEPDRPESIRFWIPSIPASSIALKAEDTGYQLGSGKRTSGRGASSGSAR